MATLFILCGVSGSGKSTEALNLLKQKAYYLENTVLVSSDNIREELSFYEDQSRNGEVFKIFHKRIAEALKNGNDCITDATNITIKSRKSIIEIGKKYNARIECRLICTPTQVCLERDVIRQHAVGKDVIEKQIRKFQVPFYEEGFDEIKLVKTVFNPIVNFTNSYSLLMYDFEQDTPFHKLTLDKHSERVANEFEKLLNNKYMFERLRDGALYHDIGKIFTKTVSLDGVAHYYNHENIGAYMYLTDAVSSNRYVDNYALLQNAFLINYHMRPFGATTERAKEKMKNTFGRMNYELLMMFNEADKNA